MISRRQCLQTLFGAVAAAALAPLVDLTDLTPKFWEQAAVRDLDLWRIVFDDTTFTFRAHVVEETIVGNLWTYVLRPTGPMKIATSMTFPINYDPPIEVEKPEPEPQSSVVSLQKPDGSYVELGDIKLPKLERHDLDVDMDGIVLGVLRRSNITLTGRFDR